MKWFIIKYDFKELWNKWNLFSDTVFWSFLFPSFNKCPGDIPLWVEYLKISIINNYFGDIFYFTQPQFVFSLTCYNNTLCWQVIILRSKQFFYVRGYVHHSKIHKEKSNKMQQCTKFHYSIFIWSSTCFDRHTAHHQEPKTALAISGFSYVKGCWPCSL
jgi:hypothetical protein